jgi:predicted glycoside hydrolase/deacetylase ChbG (UPF0249 family)
MMRGARASERRLVINADGYGFTAGLNHGIEESIAAGLVTSISVNANFDTVYALRELSARHPRLSVGVHLNPVAGRPLAETSRVPTLVGADGEFHMDGFPGLLRAGRIDAAELALELGLQIERVQALVPVVTHLDSHQNLHLRPGFFDVFLRLARRYRIERMRTHRYYICIEHAARLPAAVAFYLTHPRRVATHSAACYRMRQARRCGMRMCDRLIAPGAWATGAVRVKLDFWLAVARRCPAGTNEIYCHPGYVDDDLRRYAKVIVDQREGELRVLTDPRLRRAFTDSGVTLISFHDV